MLTSFGAKPRPSATFGGLFREPFGGAGLAAVEENERRLRAGVQAERGGERFRSGRVGVGENTGEKTVQPHPLFGGEGGVFGDEWNAVHHREVTSFKARAMHAASSSQKPVR